MIKDYVDDNIKKHIREHVVLTIEDREIGIIGYLTPEVVYLSKTGSNTWINHTWCIITSQQIYYLFCRSMQIKQSLVLLRVIYTK